ncbi:MAG: hypothetical protein M1840_005686 [Geoglossum simile]|nr:MAG: hypothetical protein M1840_005686 [Geoglossum simile]
MASRVQAHGASPPLWLLFTILGSLISIVIAAPSASTFVLPRRGSNFTFSLNVDKNSSDIYFRIVANADKSWVAVGAGPEMKDTLMFVAYQAKDSRKVTLSPRIATGHFEPAYASSINITLEPGSGITKNIFTVNARCSNCRRWGKGGSLALDSRNQDFIYAWGPTTSTIESDSKTATIQRHIAYGSFTMDLVQAAAGDAGVPEDTRSHNGTEAVGDPHADYEILLSVHALLMLGTFVILLPVGVLLLRIIQKPKLHSIAQVFGTIIVLIGGGLGIFLSYSYNLTRTFTTAHQIIGLILMALLVIQSVLGYLHHRAYVRTQRHSVYTLPHIWHGRIVILLGAVNGFLGFRLAGRSTLSYLISLLIFTISYATIYIVSRKRLRRKREALSNPRLRNPHDPDFIRPDSRSDDIPLASHAAPPAYQSDYEPQPLGPPPGNRF